MTLRVHPKVKGLCTQIKCPFTKNQLLKKKSLSYIGATLWNSLPCNLRQERSLNRFKLVLNRHCSGAPRAREENWKKFGHDVSVFQTYLRSLGMGEGSSESARLG